ncbi:DUF485 domain-containing protein [Derxia gummosa]|uniref:DUF485 domain-containing protein n=1 Tax=Derxia gummosa DSM 723 TaxID=1121388 RepID=A0A8B6X9J0_9BURK|nr:DUF485 domain-containing protein [Derxia gummosa]
MEEIVAEPLGFSLALTAVQVAVFFGFIALGCFAPALLRLPLPGLGLPAAFVAGLAVIVTGTVLTVLYVLRVNAAEA